VSVTRDTERLARLTETAEQILARLQVDAGPVTYGAWFAKWKAAAVLAEIRALRGKA
jgi:hypothetical protein